MIGHVRETHENCRRSFCVVCDLYICKVCGGAEGSLLPVCPGQRLTADEDAANYANYCAGTGPFAEATQQTLRDAYAATLRYACGRGSPGSTALYHAVAGLVCYFNLFCGRKP